MSIRGLVVSAILVFVVPHVASAQYVGPNPESVTATSVEQIHKARIDGMPVKICGKILRQLRGIRYLFGDKTWYKCILEIGDTRWPKDTPIDQKTCIEIVGQVIYKGGGRLPADSEPVIWVEVSKITVVSNDCCGHVLGE